ncbi:MAG TPA: GntR family transcriptional regulator [Candidatus Limnocylindria bacterium]
MRGLAFLTKKDAVAERLRSEIYGGSLAAGTPLQQEDVAARLAVSATPVREAFRALESEGLLESRPHHGVVVARQDQADIEAIYEIRIAVELQALRRAIARLDARAIAEIGAVLERSRRALAKADLAAFRRGNGDFHRLIAAASGSRIHTEIGQSLITRSTHYASLDRERMRHVHAQHVAIVAALRAKHGSRALELMEQHLKANLKLLPVSRPTAAAKGRRRPNGAAPSD